MPNPLPRALLVSMLALTACGVPQELPPGPNPMLPDASTQRADASVATVDAGLNRDAGALDSGQIIATDGGAARDAGPSIDAGAPGDAGLSRDGGAAADAGSRTDAGSSLDAGTCPCAPEANATSACVSGLCTSTCLAGYARCDGVCVAETPTQCGPSCRSCYAPLGATASCSLGICSFSCDAGFPGDNDQCRALQTEQVDPEPMSGSLTALASDSKHALQVVYYEPGRGQLVAGKQTTTGWRFESLGKSYGYTHMPSLVIGPDDQPALLTTDWQLFSSLVFARRTLAGWVAEQVVPFIPPAYDLAVDAAGQAHACFASSGGGLSYAIRRGDRWFIEVVDQTPTAMDDCKITVNTAGRVTIAAASRVGVVEVATKPLKGAFTLKIVDTLNSGIRLAMTTDASQNVHLAYYDPVHQDLRYAAESTSFAATTAVSTGNVGQWPVIAIDAAGKPVIGYWDGTAYRARAAKLGAGTWSNFPIGVDIDSAPMSASTDAQGRVVIAVDPSRGEIALATLETGGTFTLSAVVASRVAADVLSTAAQLAAPAALYQDVTQSGGGPSTKGVTFAQRASNGTWATVDLGRNLGSPSLVADAAGTLHASMQAQTAWDLIYATRAAAGGAWTMQTVDATGYAGSDSSIALDSAGHPKIAYTRSDGSVNSLRLAEWNGTAWVTSEVLAATFVGHHTLQLGAGDVPMIAWYDSVAKASKLTTRTSGTWSTQIIDALPSASPFFTLHPNGTPAFCYPRSVSSAPSAAQELVYRLGVGTDSTTQTVPIGTHIVSGGCALAFEPNTNEPWVVHATRYGAGLGIIRIAHRTGGTTWASQYVDDDFYLWGAGIGFTPQGALQMFYSGEPYSGSGTDRFRLRFGSK